MPPPAEGEGIRLQKVLAAAGVGSRRACEELIAAGRVSVDGRVVRTLGTRVDASAVAIHVDGSRIAAAAGHIVLALNKPAGVVTTMSDPKGRPCVGEMVSDRSERLFHIGRLDTDSEGLLLLTNDGDLAQRLAHPSHGVPKTYLVQVTGAIPRDLGKRLRAGVEIDGATVTVDRFRVMESSGNRVLVEVVLHEGRNRIVRRIFDSVGLPVDRLVRTRVGPIVLGDLRVGRTRVLGAAESASLYRAVDL